MVSESGCIERCGARIETKGRSSMRDLDRLEQEVASWAGVSVHPHRFGGREFH
jgi:hypothetical protein